MGLEGARMALQLAQRLEDEDHGLAQAALELWQSEADGQQIRKGCQKPQVTSKNP